MKILLKVNSIQLQQQLDALGHDCRTLDEAHPWRELCRFCPDLVIVSADDDESPQQLIREIRTADSGWTPVLLFTSAQGADASRAALDSGADDHLCVPVIPEQLRLKLSLLEKISALRQQTTQFPSCGEGADSLTTLPNRTALNQHLIREYARCARNNSPLAMVLIRINNLENCSQRHSRLISDCCQQKIARILCEESPRASDVIGRFDEITFAFILADTDLPGSATVARRVQKRLEAMELPIAISTNEKAIEFSIGVAATTPEPGESEVRLVTLAVEALEQAALEGDGHTESDNRRL